MRARVSLSLSRLVKGGRHARLVSRKRDSYTPGFTPRHAKPDHIDVSITRPMEMAA